MFLTTVFALLLAPSLAAAPATPAAPPATLRGRVFEAYSGQPLSGATVAAAGVTARTDADGSFALVMPPGSWTLETRFDGHAPYSRSVSVSAGEDRRLDVYLMELGRFSEEVLVTTPADAPTDRPASLSVRPLDVMGVAGGAENVFRALQTLPGVAGVEEFGSRVAVRGGGPDENLTVMDGVEIHNPYRLFGLTSAFNPESVRSFDLFSGAFVAKYGDRLSSLLLVENRDGRAGGFRGAISLSLTDANLVLEGSLPRAAKGSWLVTARRTYYDLVAERFTESKLPGFADVQARAVFEPRAGQRLSLIALRSRESADALFTNDRPGERGNFVTAARSDLLSLGFESNLGSRASSRTRLSFYRNTDALDVDARFRAGARRSNASDDQLAFSVANVVFTRDLSVRDLSLRQDFAWQLSDRHLLEAGAELHDLSTGVSWRIAGERNSSEANGSSVRGGVGLPSQLDSQLRGTRAGVYLEERYQMMQRLVLEPGLRLDRSSVNGRAVLQPRLSASLSLGAHTRLRAGGGLYAQSPGYEKLIQSDYFLDLTEARALDLPHERAVHAVLGLERDLAPGASARVEGYYKRFSDLIVGRMETEAERRARVAQYDFPSELSSSIPTAPQITSVPASDGRGSSYGVDVFVSRRATSPETRLTGWIGYTWGRARRDAYRRAYPFEYDRRHALNLVSHWRFGPKFEVSATGKLYSGFPRTPVVGLRVSAVAGQDGGATRLVPERDLGGDLVWTTDLGGVSNLNRARLPLYARVDLRANWKPRGEAGRWLFYLDVINLLNRQNVGAYQATLEYDPSSDRPRLVEKSAQRIPFLPSFGIRFRF